MTQLSTIKIIIISYLNCDNLFKNGNRILGISAKYMTACMQTTDDSNILLESKKENKFLLFYYSVKCPSIKCMEFSFELVLWVLSQLIHYLIKVSLHFYRYYTGTLYSVYSTIKNWKLDVFYITGRKHSIVWKIRYISILKKSMYYKKLKKRVDLLILVLIFKSLGVYLLCKVLLIYWWWQQQFQTKITNL